MKKLFKTAVLAASVVFLLSIQFSVSSCTKEKIIHDTSYVQVHDTTLAHDTMKLAIQPCNNQFESSVDSYYPTGNGNGSTEIAMGAWTHGGAPENNRTYIKFDYSEIPANAIIISANLSLWAHHSPTSGNFVDAHFGTANACYIQRVTSDWSLATLSWNNQPITTDANQKVIPQSASSFEDNVGMDVTQLVKDMFAAGKNYGFNIKLQAENTYNIRQYYSSFNGDCDKNPKLVIYYKKP